MASRSKENAACTTEVPARRRVAGISAGPVQEGRRRRNNTCLRNFLLAQDMPLCYGHLQASGGVSAFYAPSFLQRRDKRKRNLPPTKPLHACCVFAE
jgi:hypothetical protein